MTAGILDASARGLRIVAEGRVQGVGFRPWVLRNAAELNLAGEVRNTRAGATIDLEGDPDDLAEFVERLRSRAPAVARIRSTTTEALPSHGFPARGPFAIAGSRTAGSASLEPTPDLALCLACRAEIRDARDRRFAHPFASCAECGPRYTIARAYPWDRERTTMRAFPMCDDCRREYDSPTDRRAHAQTIACPACGPRLAWFGAVEPDASRGVGIDSQPETRALAPLRAGGIVAVKGIGGFHLVADARNEAAVARLRAAKRRPEKPFAVLFPDVASVEAEAVVGDAERTALESPEAPVVLLARRAGSSLAPSVSPANALLGAMLPYSPLHEILARAFGAPLVVTSANLGDEPLAVERFEVERDFGSASAGTLDHDRPIARRADDSVARVVDGAPVPFRVGRGLAPVAIDVAPLLPSRRHPVVLALGAHEKCAIALAADGRILLGPHVGDMETTAAREALREAVEDWLRLFGRRPEIVACDLHPDWHSSDLARELADRFGARLVPVQHHLAHFASAIADAGETLSGLRKVAGICWDGTGFGEDGSVRGGEWFAAEPPFARARRVASFLPFDLPGGAACVREPWRVALALTRVAGVPDAGLRSAARPDRGGFSPDPRVVRNVARLAPARSPQSTSAGRLFEGIASLLGLRHREGYSAQAAMDLEFAATGATAHREYPIAFARVGQASCLSGIRERASRETELSEVALAFDWRPTVRAIVEDLDRAAPVARVAAAFHDALARVAATVCSRAGAEVALLSGGCFQNKRLAEGALRRLREAGIDARVHRLAPPNDGGIAVGQALAALLGTALDPSRDASPDRPVAEGGTAPCA